MNNGSSLSQAERAPEGLSENGRSRAGSAPWGVTRFSRQTERRIYFSLTMAAVALWILTWIWQACTGEAGQGPQFR